MFSALTPPNPPAEAAPPLQDRVTRLNSRRSPPQGAGWNDLGACSPSRLPLARTTVSAAERSVPRTERGRCPSRQRSRRRQLPQGPAGPTSTRDPQEAADHQTRRKPRIISLVRLDRPVPQAGDRIRAPHGRAVCDREVVAVSVSELRTKGAVQRHRVCEPWLSANEDAADCLAENGHGNRRPLRRRARSPRSTAGRAGRVPRAGITPAGPQQQQPDWIAGMLAPAYEPPLTARSSRAAAVRHRPGPDGGWGTPSHRTAGER